jgi:DUF1680 family protein
MACCNAAGTRALYDLWHYATDDDGRHCRVHMAFSRPTSWGDVVSYQPFDGRVDVSMRAPRSLSVRIPGWVAWSQVQISVNDQPAQYERQGAYARLPRLQPGDVVSVRYPLPIESRTYRLGDAVYVATYKGATVVNVTPGGTFCPLYQRDHYLGLNPPQAEQLWHLPTWEITPGL